MGRRQCGNADAFQTDDSSGALIQARLLVGGGKTHFTGNIVLAKSASPPLRSVAGSRWSRASTRVSTRHALGRAPHFIQQMLSPPGVAHGFGYESLGVADVQGGGVAPAGGGSVGFGLGQVAFGGIEQLHRFTETAFPTEAAVDGGMIVNVFSVVDGGAFGFADGAGEAEVGDGAQIARMHGGRRGY